MSSQIPKITTVLADFVREPLRPLIVPGTGFDFVQEDGSPFELELQSYKHLSDDEHVWHYRLSPSPLELTCQLSLVRSHKAARWRLSLRNPTDDSALKLKKCTPLTIKLNAKELPVRVFCISGDTGVRDPYPCAVFQGHEFRLIQEVSEGPLKLRSDLGGRSSGDYLPIFMVTVGEVPQRLGFFAGLEWSGLWTADFSWLYNPENKTVKTESGVFQVNLGQVKPRTFEEETMSWMYPDSAVSDIMVSPGEQIDLPEVHFGLFEGDFEVGTNSVRRYIYDQICPNLSGKKPMPPTSYDHWFGIRNYFDEDFLRKQVDIAAQMGLEYFILDAGWHAGSPSNEMNWMIAEGYWGNWAGNWRRVELTKFPKGLEPLSKYVKSKGLKFGLWFDIERAVRGSDLQKEHPEWFFDIGDRTVHLNLGLPGAQEYAIETIGNWIERLDLYWIRYDYNIAPIKFWQKADPFGKIQFHYMKGLYHVLDSLMKKYPHLLLEQCAAGGRRTDLGTLKRMHTLWISDGTYIPEICRLVQTGANSFLPGNLPETSIATVRGTKRDDIAYHDILSRMCGPFQLSGDLTGWSKIVIQRLKIMVDKYKSFRHLLVKDFYRLARQPVTDSDWDVVQFHDPQKQEGLVFAFRMAGNSVEQQIRFKALKESSYYTVQDVIEDSTEKISGKQLLTSGFKFTLPEKGAKLLHYYSEPA